jgi:hypothetical protein
MRYLFCPTDNKEDRMLKVFAGFILAVIFGSVIIGGMLLLADQVSVTVPHVLFWGGIGVALAYWGIAMIATYKYNRFCVAFWRSEPHTNPVKIALPVLLVLGAAVAHYVGL